MKEVLLDTETTGLSSVSDKIIEIACIEIDDHIPTGKKAQQRFFKIMFLEVARSTNTFLEAHAHTKHFLEVLALTNHIFRRSALSKHILF